MRYEDTYVRAFPFDKIVESILRPEMILETVDLKCQAIDQKVLVNVIINNRSGGNAPLIAQMIARKFLERVAPPPKPKGQMSFWET
jgi:hypothetical protein